eukprot:7756187-Pyramimonas_sp.AAC.1
MNVFNTTYYYGCVWKRDAAINGGCDCKGGTAINETAHSFCPRSKRDAAINGFESKRDTAINGFSLKRIALRSTVSHYPRLHTSAG